MKKLVFILIYLLTICCPIASAEIIQTSTLAPIEAALKKADADTLVIFDVDGVLIEDYEKKFRNYIQEIEEKYEETKADELLSILYLNSKNKLIDSQISKVIEELQNKKINVLFLTACDTGSWGKMTSLEEWRIHDLKSFGIDTSRSFRDVKAVTFTFIPSKDPKRFPCFQEGIVFTCHLPKGKLLKAFLKYTGLSPKKIIFIDDKRSNLESIEEFCKETGKKHTGFEYTAFTERPKLPLDEKRAHLQFEILEKEHKWLSDDEANEMLNARSFQAQGQ